MIIWELNTYLSLSMATDPATAFGSTVTFHVRLLLKVCVAARLQQPWSLGKAGIGRFESEHSKICVKIDIFPLSAKNFVLVS